MARFVPRTKPPTHPGAFRHTVLPIAAPATSGVALLPDELSGARFVLSAAWGADLTANPSTWTWYDISSDMLQDPAAVIQVGKQQENQTASPAQLTLTLDNRANLYTAFNPLCANYPYVRDGTPIRVQLIISGVTYTRFQGRAVEWEPSWDTTGEYAVTNLTAAGLSRTLNLAQTPTTSALRRFIPNTSPAPSFYCPLEDGPNATVLASGLTGGTAMTLYGADLSFSPWQLAQTTDVPGSAPLPAFGIGSGVECKATAPVSMTSDTEWSIGWISYIGATLLPASNTPEFFAIFVNPGGTWQDATAVLNSTTGALTITGTQVGGAATDTWVSYDPGNLYDGLWHVFRFTAKQSGGNTAFTIEMDGSTVYTNSVSGTLTRIYRVNVAGLGSVPYAVGHLTIWPTASAITNFSSAGSGWFGETPSARMTRIAGENDISFQTLGFYSSDVLMADQPYDTVMNIWRDCELTDAGYLYDGLNDGFTFVGISQRYDQFSQFTLDASIGDIQPPFEPVADDFARANKASVTRRNGITDIYEDDSGPLGVNTVGEYLAELSGSPNYSNDTPVKNRSRWLVHQGTVRGFRYPQLLVNVRTIPDRAAAIAGMYPSQSLTLVSPYTTQLAGEQVDLVVEGWTENLAPPYVWEWTPYCTRQDVYLVWKIGDAQLGRLGTEGHTINTDAATGATTLLLRTLDGKPLWTTDSGDFPLYIECLGIKITVSAITGSSTPQTATVTGVTKPLPAGSAITIWKNGVIKL